MPRKPRRSSVVREFVGVELGDARRSARVLKVVADLEKAPAVGLPRATKTTAALEGAYRLLNNEHVQLESLLATHGRLTVERARQAGGRPLVVIDPTAFVFHGESEREDVERLGADRHGFDAFVALAVTRTRRPLGVLSIRPTKSRGRAGADEWAAVVANVAEKLGDVEATYVMDREADAYALFAALIDGGQEFIVRVAADRWVKEQHDGAKEMLRELASRAPTILVRDVKLARRSKLGRAPDARRRHPPRDGRNATLSIRASSVILPRPPKLPTSLPDSLSLSVIHVVEERPPSGEPGVEWLLFSTRAIANADDAAEIVDGYRARWTIEEYFKALKTGCAYEKRQLESRHALLNALAILAPIAWQLLALRSVGDDSVPASAFLDEDELTVLRSLSRDIKLGRSPTCAEAILAIAMLGGHIKNNGRPGWQTIWGGYEELASVVLGYRLAKAKK